MQGISSLTTASRSKNRPPSEVAASDASASASGQASAVHLETPEAQLYALQDDLGMMLAQNARRKDVERMRSRVSDETELILEEDRENRLERLARALKSGNQSLREFLRQARGLFPDDSDLVIALRSRRRMLAAKGGEGQDAGDTTDGAGSYGRVGKARLLDAAIERVFKEGDERHIKAGINATAHARRFGQRLNLCTRMLRGIYRDFLDFAEALPDLYDDWLSRFAYDQRLGLAQYIAGALIADRRAQDPSCEHVVFSSLFAQCEVLRMMASAESYFLQLKPYIDVNDTPTPSEQHLAGLMTTMMREPSQVKLAMSALCLQADMLNARERFVQSAYRAFAALPSALYSDVTCRETILTEILDLATPCF